MKLKEFFLMMFCAFPLLSFAAEQQIEVNTNEWNILDKGRSIPSVPLLTHDDNLLFIYSDVPLENLQIEVKDESGNVVYMDNVSIAAGQMYSFVLEGASVGDYVIKLLCVQKSLWGNFELED